jgi:hypothetical protein
MKNHLQQLQDDLRVAIDGMSEAQLRCHPEGKWCAAEILEHLFRTYRGTVKGLEKCLAEGKPFVATSSWRAWAMKVVVIYGGYMPKGRKSPERVLPKGMPVQQLLEELRPIISRMDALFAEGEAQFGRSTKFLSHPVLGPLSGPEWRKFHWVHGRLHIQQILECRRLGAEFHGGKASN